MTDESATGGPGGERAPGRLALALRLLALAALALVALRLLADPTRTNGDAASLLMQVVVYVEGRAPVSVLAGMNPPLILYFCAVPVLLSGALGVPLLALHTALVALVVAVSTWSLRRTLRSFPLPETASALALLGFALAQLLVTGEAFSWGQRDHLFATVVVPYLALRVARLEGAPCGPLRSVLVGLLAAFGVLLKPYFAVPVAAAEAALAVLYRRWPTLRHPEVGAAFAAAAAYAAHFALLPAAYTGALREALWQTAGGYAAFDAPPRELLGNPWVAPVLLLALVPLLALGRGATPWRRLAAVLGAFTLGGLAAFGLQHKGFGHHLVPPLTGALVLSGAVAREVALLFAPRAGARGSRAIGLAAGAAAACASALLAVALAGGARAALRLAREGVKVPVRTPLQAVLLSRSAPKDEVVFFSTTIPLAYPVLLEADRRPLGRFAGPLMEVAYFQPGPRDRDRVPAYRPLDGMEPAERALLGDLAREIDERRPRLVLVATSRNFGCPPAFSFLPYLEAAGFFEGPLAPYRHVSDVVDRWGDVQVWERADAPAAPPGQPRAAPARPSRSDAATHSSIGGVSPG